MAFGEWLGSENGKEMLTEIFTNCTKEQARAAVTTYCCIFKTEVDTSQWDNLMQWIYDYYNSWFESYDEMDSYMAALLV